MKNNGPFNVLDDVAKDYIPNNTNLVPHLAARLGKRSSLMKQIRTRPIMAMVIALLILLALSGVVYALGRAFGYIPGLGLVENNTGMRMLEEPASVTRDGVTLTIKQLLVYSDHIQMVYETSGIAPENISYSAADGNTSPKAFCGGTNIGDYANTEGDPIIRLPDGTRIERMGGYDERYPENTYTNMPVFIASVPADITDMTVTFKCIYGARLGTTPENWEIPVKLKSVPAGTVIGEPVLEVTPSASSSASDNGITISLDRVVPQDGKYLFYCSVVAENKGQPFSHTYPASAFLVDSTGQKVQLVDFRPPSIQETDQNWELQPTSQVAYGPYKLVIQKIFAYYEADNVSFEFDPGPNPQVGQTWQLDQTLHLGGVDVKVVSAKMIEKDLTSWGMSENTQGIEFTFQSADGITLIHQLDIMDGDAQHNMDGMVTPDSDPWSEPSTNISVRLFYEKGIPTDKIPVVIYKESVVVPGHWAFEWAAPEQTSVNLLDAATSIVSESNASDVTAELNRVVKLDDGYLFYIKMNTPKQDPAFRAIEPVIVYVIDSSGKKVNLNLDAPQPFYAHKDDMWQFSTKETLANGPLKIVVEKAKAHYTNFNFDYFETSPSAETLEQVTEEHSFTFDVGENPQVDQAWTLNQEFELGGYKGKVISARAVTVDSQQLPFPELQSDTSINLGYEFVIEALDPSIEWNVGMYIDRPGGNKPSNSVDCIGGMDGDYGPETTHTVTCRGLFNGVLRAFFSEITVLLNNNWEIDWTLSV